ncbi:MAG: hypothetical protein Q9225_008026, partial [Loekoesia sp. 1 TL-2023]
MASSSSSSLSPPPPEKPATRYSKRKRGEEPSPPPQTNVSPAKKLKTTHRPPGINTGAKTVPAKRKGKAAAGLPSNLPRVAPEPIAPYPSPFADLGGEGGWRIETTDASDALKTAFAIQSIMGRPEFEWEKEAGFARWYRHANHEVETYVDYGLMCTRPVLGETWIAAYGQISWEDQISRAKPTKQGRANAPRTRQAMEIFREGDADNAEFYLTWNKVNEVKVNGRTCVLEHEDDVEFAIGPLPSYAIIEVEKTVIFWFRDTQAMDFVTPQIEQMRLDKELLGDMEGWQDEE